MEGAGGPKLTLHKKEDMIHAQEGNVWLPISREDWGSSRAHAAGLDLLEELRAGHTTAVHTALADCHAVGLSSFVLHGNYHSRHPVQLRLFLADESCELRKPYRIWNPLLAIHPHKYEDTFVPIAGTLRHHLYGSVSDLETEAGVGSMAVSLGTYRRRARRFNAYRYPRLDDSHAPVLDGQGCLVYMGYRDTSLATPLVSLDANALHSAEVCGNGNEPCAWLVVQGRRDAGFQPIAYHQDLRHRPELNRPMSAYEAERKLELVRELVKQYVLRV